MAKAKKTVFFCQNCGYESPKWLGQCPGCKEWNTFVEETVLPKSSGISGNGQRIKAFFYLKLWDKGVSNNRDSAQAKGMSLHCKVKNVVLLKSSES